MYDLIWLLAKRYLLASNREHTISIMIKICFVGILIGTCALALVISIMKGFEQATAEQLQGIHAQIIMRPQSDDEIDEKKVAQALETDFHDLVAAYSPSCIAQVIVQKPGSSEISSVMELRGIDPFKEARTSSLEHKIIDDKTLHATVHDNHILIGNECAQTLGLQKGDTVTLLFMHKLNKKGQPIFESIPAYIGGVFKTGIEEFDSSLALCSLPFFNQLFPESGITHFNIRLHAHINEAIALEKLRHYFDSFDVYSWHDLYPALMQALVLEKYAMFLILLLMVFVACMGILSLIFMMITQKQGDIAILTAMGMPSRHLHLVFLLIGTILTAASAFCGLIIAWCAGMVIEYFQLISLPDIYYVSHVPVTLEVSTFLSLFFLIVFLGIGASWLPIRNMKWIKVADVLRFEA